MTVIQLLRCAARKKPAELSHEDIHGSNDEHGLKRVMGLGSVVLFGFSAVVGGGIFRSAGAAAYNYTGPSVYLAYMIGAVCCFLTGLCYIDFAKRLHAAGGGYTYVYASLGELAALVAALCLTFEYALGSACISRAASEYLTETLHSQLAIDVPWKVSENSLFRMDPVAPSICVLLTCLSLLGLRRGQRVSSVVSCICICLILILVAAALSQFNAAHFTQEPSQFPFGWRAMIRAASDVYFNFTGYSAIVALGEDVHDPGVTLPRALAIVLIMVGTLYGAISVALIGLVKYSDINTAAPFISGFENSSLPWMGKVVTATVLLCACNAVYSATVGQPRIWFGVSRDGLLPRQFSTVWGIENVPLFSLAITGAIMTVFAGFVEYKALQGIISAGVLLLQAMISLGCLVDHLHSMRITIALSVAGLASFLAAAFLLGGNVQEDPITRRSALPEPVMGGFYAAVAVLGLSLCFLVILLNVKHQTIRGASVALAAFIVNCFLLGSLELTTLAIFAGICILVIPLYFLYGVNHFKLNTRAAN